MPKTPHLTIKETRDHKIVVEKRTPWKQEATTGQIFEGESVEELSSWSILFHGRPFAVKLASAFISGYRRKEKEIKDQ